LSDAVFNWTEIVSNIWGDYDKRAVKASHQIISIYADLPLGLVKFQIRKTKK